MSLESLTNNMHHSLVHLKLHISCLVVACCSNSIPEAMASMMTCNTFNFIPLSSVLRLTYSARVQVLPNNSGVQIWLQVMNQT